MSSPMPEKHMDDLTARVGRLEVIAWETRADVAAIKATLPHLASKAELADLRTEVTGLRTELKGDIGRLEAHIERVDGNIARMEARVIKWVVGSAIASVGSLIACASLAVTATKLIR